MKATTTLIAAMAAVPSLLSTSAMAKTLDIYFIDVEGGQSTLVVTPQGETLLIDTGFAGSPAGAAPIPGIESSSHASRIAAAARDAGAKKIDYLLITHFHGDHMGGAPELAKLLPIGSFVDHGTLAQSEQSPRSMEPFEAYAKVRATGRHIEPKPGDQLPLKGVEVTVVSSAAQVLTKSLSGAGKPNAVCDAGRPAEDLGENARSTGIVVKWGKFRFLDIGDLTTRPLYDIACPNDLIGPVDVYLVAHHGGADAAESATFASFRPRVSVVNNGAKKGGALKLYEHLQNDKLVGEVWQLHRSQAAGDSNFTDERIANVDESTAHWIKVSANEDGSFRVTNGRTGKSSDYKAR
ncbi:MAG TPA: MBL fold metallo-hydrolase [Steroidobacteraceae bacterium]|nr:MBL fold metallo-hydrolase [Steroidobacteraceae bacterium]